MIPYPKLRNTWGAECPYRGVSLGSALWQLLDSKKLTYLSPFWTCRSWTCAVSWRIIGVGFGFWVRLSCIASKLSVEQPLVAPALTHSCMGTFFIIAIMSDFNGEVVPSTGLYGRHRTIISLNIGASKGASKYDCKVMWTTPAANGLNTCSNSPLDVPRPHLLALIL